MTDNEIIKALECCIKDNCDCGECPAIPVCQHDFDCPKTIALELINRQKAEIERLVKGFEEVKKGIEEAKVLVAKDIAKAKAEAVKEFAERLKKELSFGKHIQADQIDNLLKEMVGDNNARNIVSR